MVTIQGSSISSFANLLLFMPIFIPFQLCQTTKYNFTISTASNAGCFPVDL